jgi:hypothetical protein
MIARPADLYALDSVRAVLLGGLRDRIVPTST